MKTIYNQPLTLLMAMKIPTVIFLLITMFMVVIQSCDPSEEGDDISPPLPPPVSPETVLTWNSMIQKVNTFKVDEGFPPPIISRVFAIYHVAMHDALNSIDQKYETYASEVMDEEADPDAAVSQAVYDVLVQVGLLKDKAKISIDSLFEVSMARISAGIRKDKGIALGKAVAQAVLAKRSADVPFLLLVGYDPTPVSGSNPGEYRHIPPLNYALAGFHLMQPWVMQSGDQFPVEPPYAINSAGYTADYNEVLDLGEMNSSSRTADQKDLGIFWAENTSKGWNEVARSIMKVADEPEDAYTAARFFAVLHMAIADSYISVFDSKMYYNYWRPISAIHEGDTDGNPDTDGNTNWQATLSTPPVGEYPSAHAMTGATAGQVLIRFFGKSNIPFSITSGYLPGTRSFPDIDAAIRENSLSRIFIGYHFRKAVEAGEEVGYDIGNYIYDNALRPK